MTSRLERFYAARRAILEDGRVTAYADIDEIAAGADLAGLLARDFLISHPFPLSSPLAEAPALPLEAKLPPLRRNIAQTLEIHATGAGRREGVMISELEADICRAERLRVVLSSSNPPDTRFRPYGLTSPSPGVMTAEELAQQIERSYPGVTCHTPRGSIRLQVLRTRQG